MKSWIFILVSLLVTISFSIGFSVARRQVSYIADSTSDSSSGQQTSANPSLSGGSSSGGSSNNNTSPSPNPLANPQENPFNYSPLPAVQGPENDIIESSPLTATRTTVQVDDSATFNVTVKNQAPYTKTLYNLCFESTDGNFGCVFNITLSPGQTYSISNVGHWVHPGEKQVWITWSQDNVNYYTPVNANTITVNVLG